MLFLQSTIECIKCVTSYEKVWNALSMAGNLHVCTLYSQTRHAKSVIFLMTQFVRILRQSICANFTWIWRQRVYILIQIAVRITVFYIRSPRLLAHHTCCTSGVLQCKYIPEYCNVSASLTLLYFTLITKINITLSLAHAKNLQHTLYLRPRKTYTTGQK